MTGSSSANALVPQKTVQRFAQAAPAQAPAAQMQLVQQQPVQQLMHQGCVLFLFVSTSKMLCLATQSFQSNYGYQQPYAYQQPIVRANL